LFVCCSGVGGELVGCVSLSLFDSNFVLGIVGLFFFVVDFFELFFFFFVGRYGVWDCFRDWSLFGGWFVVLNILRTLDID